MTHQPWRFLPSRPAARSATVVVAVVAILAMFAGAALAFWGSTDSSNPARAAADVLQAGSAPTGSSTNQNVTVTWTARSTVGGRAATGYSVNRYASAAGGTAVPAGGGCGGTITVLTCTEAGVPAGVWYYTVTPKLSLWVGNESARTLVSVNQAPAITTPPSVTFTVGVAASFTVSTTGFPAATVSETASLPAGITFTNNGNGTATLGGTPGSNTGGTYSLTMTASNGTLPNATQPFTLTVNQAPAITSAPGVTLTVGTAGSFTVQTTGFPTAPTITGSGSLPGGVTFVNNGNGTATLSGNPGTSGTFALTITASNGVAPNATQNFTLTVGTRHLLLTPATTTPAAGTADNLTITALDGANNVVTTYAGTKSLVFGGANSMGTFSPSVVNSAGVTTTFGASTSVTFTAGVATVSGGKNGVMTLYTAEAATITVSDGTINNAPGLSVTVKSAAPAGLALTNPDHAVSCGSVSGNYTCTASPGLPNGGSMTANVSFVDSFGNLTAQSSTTDATISLSTPTKGTALPTPLTILKGTTTSTATFTLTKTNGNSTATTAVTFGSTFTLTLSTN
ncbi:MAG: hypothetical protein QOD01_843 [Actinomycetota bacterium]|nr:hypothetical protein [Actinomycetota bacterium]